MVGVGLTKPRMRRVWVVAPELLMIDGLDLLTGLSTLAHLHSTTRSVRFDLGETCARFHHKMVRDAASGVFPSQHAFNHEPRKIRSEFRGMETMIMHTRPPTPDLYS